MIKKSRESATSPATSNAADDSMVGHLFTRVSEEKAALQNQTAETGSEEDVSDIRAWVRFVLCTCKMTVDWGFRVYP